MVLAVGRSIASPARLLVFGIVGLVLAGELVVVVVVVVVVVAVVEVVVSLLFEELEVADDPEEDVEEELELLSLSESDGASA